MAGEARRARIRALLRRAGAGNVATDAVIGAFVHASAVRERAAEAVDAGDPLRSNERLEFLGDAIIGYVVARWLFTRYPDAPEGELALRKAGLVSDVALAETASRLRLGDVLILGAGEARRPAGPAGAMLADAFEAFVGALATAAGIESATLFVEREHIVPCERLRRPLGDPKTTLQEWTQSQYRSTPTYADRFEGPPHARTFHARVWVEGEWLTEGSGPSKKEAQRAAAAQALQILGERHPELAPQTSGALKSSRRTASKTTRT